MKNLAGILKKIILNNNDIIVLKLFIERKLIKESQ